MLTTSAYLLAWLAYLAAAAGLVAVVYRITRGWRPVAFRVTLRTLPLVWLVMPATVEPGAARETLAPAFIVLLFESWNGVDAATRVLEPMLFLSIGAIPVALVCQWFWSRWLARRAARHAHGVPRP